MRGLPPASSRGEIVSPPLRGIGGVPIPGTLSPRESDTRETSQDREIALLRARVTALEEAARGKPGSLGPDQAEVTWAGARARGPAWSLIALLARLHRGVEDQCPRVDRRAVSDD
jgi:hypothetical protein